MAIDVSAATEAYLNQIPSGREAAAIAYTRGSHWILLWSKLVSCGAAVLLARISAERILPSRLRGKATPNRTAFATSLTILLLYLLLEQPWFAYADWARDRTYGFTGQPLGAWILEYLAQAIASACVGATLLTAFYAGARGAGRYWWIWGSALAGVGLVLALVVQPIVLAPVLNRYEPAPAGKIRAAVETVLSRGGVQGDRVFVYDGSRQNNRYTASVTGIGTTATVALSDTMFAHGADAAQVTAVVAHELGHQRHGHRLILAAVLTAIVGIGLLLADRLFGPAAELFEATASPTISDPRGLPILLAIFALYSLLTTPLVNTAQRLLEADADRYGLALARAPDGMARAVIAASDYRASSPSPLQEMLFYDHPSNARRIREAMQWKADQQLSQKEPVP